jgi:hypothetical protein
MHVARNRRTYVAKSGQARVYESVLLRRTYRDGGKVKHETLANLKALPEAAVEAIEATLKGQRLVPAGQAFQITRSLPHGHVAAVSAMAGRLGLPALLGPACRQRDLVLALIISRVVKPTSKLSTLTWWSDTTLGVDLGVVDASTDEIYAAMDWLHDRQDSIEAKLAAKHLSVPANPSRMALFDLTSAWMEGPLPQLRWPARPPRHPHPQPRPLPRNRHRPTHPHRGHTRPAPGLRPHRRTHPAHRSVATTTTTQTTNPQLSWGFACHSPRNFGLDRSCRNSL